jgi:hypothetical protein
MGFNFKQVVQIFFMFPFEVNGGMIGILEISKSPTPNGMGDQVEF